LIPTRNGGGKTLRVGDPSPGFELLSDKGGSVRLSAFRGKRAIVWSRPKADMPGCTERPCAVQDYRPQIVDVGVTVIELCPDAPGKPSTFRAKDNLGYFLQSGPGRKASAACGAWGGKRAHVKKQEGSIGSCARSVRK